MSNPILSVSEWMGAAGHGLQSLKLYEALVMEETGETLGAYFVHDGLQVDSVLPGFARGLLDAAKLLRESDELYLGVPDPVALLDGHLDSVWVHLCAALALLGGDTEKLARAWAEIHRSNVDGKKVDGQFVIGPSGKVTKPVGWTPPDLEQFFDHIPKE